MKKYIVEEKMNTGANGYYLVVVEGERHLNRTIIKSDIQFFTDQGGYNHNHPRSAAKKNAQAIADGLNRAQETPSIIVEISGGLVTSIITQEPVKAIVLDYDTDGVDEEDLLYFQEGNEQKLSPAYVYQGQINDLQPGKVRQIVKTVNKEKG